jgi:hypothetical protein
MAMAVLAVGFGLFVALLRGYLVHRSQGGGPPPQTRAPQPPRSKSPGSGLPPRRLPVLARIPET